MVKYILFPNFVQDINLVVLHIGFRELVCLIVIKNIQEFVKIFWYQFFHKKIYLLFVFLDRQFHMLQLWTICHYQACTCVRYWAR
jgi:hypothetical protein